LVVEALVRTGINNLLAMVPRSTHIGDQLWFLRGAKVPFVLGPMRNGRYELIRETYVHGYMQGEVFARNGLKAKDAVLVELQ
jgi:hypothetical protein